MATISSKVRVVDLAIVTCETCRKEKSLRYASRLELAELVKSKGWRIKDDKVLCQACLAGG